MDTVAELVHHYLQNPAYVESEENVPYELRDQLQYMESDSQVARIVALLVPLSQGEEDLSATEMQDLVNQKLQTDYRGEDWDAWFEYTTRLLQERFGRDRSGESKTYHLEKADQIVFRRYPFCDAID